MIFKENYLSKLLAIGISVAIYSIQKNAHTEIIMTSNM